MTKPPVAIPLNPEPEYEVPVAMVNESEKQRKLPVWAVVPITMTFAFLGLITLSGGLFFADLSEFSASAAYGNSFVAGVVSSSGIFVASRVGFGVERG